jgi:hypothetical protein
MAGIWKRGNYWRAEIRREGYPPQNRTFDTRADAEAWARRAKSEMDRGAFVDRKEAEITSFGEPRDVPLWSQISIKSLSLIGRRSIVGKSVTTKPPAAKFSSSHS